MQIYKNIAIIVVKEVNVLSEYVNENADIFDEDEGGKPKQHIAIRILKWIAVAVIIAIVGIMFYRCATHRYEPAVSDKILMNGEFVELYKENPESVTVRKYGIQKPWVDVLERQGRLMEFKFLYYIPATRQLQITLKYNNDIVPEEFSTLPESGTSEDMTGIPFEISLVDETKKEYTSFVYEADERERYRYIRLCFDDVDLETGELDENGNEIRHTFYVKLKKITPEGEFTDVCLGGKHKVYDGTDIKNEVYDIVKFEVE